MLLLLTTMTIGVLLASGVALGVSQKFSNPSTILIPPVGTADPYPSEITVAAMPSTIRDVNLHLKGYRHIFPDDVGVLLVGPTGQSALVMSDVGGNIDVVGLRLILDDEATTSLPDNAQITDDPINRYKPTQGTTSTTGPLDNPVPVPFPPPAPAPPPGGDYGTTLSVFDGTNPNGVWKLYVLDDTDELKGKFARGWALRINAS